MANKSISELLRGETRFGRLTFIREGPVRGKRRYARCRCDCGNELDIRVDTLRISRSCGCIADEAKAVRTPVEEYFGPSRRAGRLVVIREVEGTPTKGNGTIRRALFKCDCGVEKVIRLSSVKSGAVVSCGCKKREEAKALAEDYCVKHGDARLGARAPEYGIYRTMLSRCFNPKVERYPEYGGRGIMVCDEWRGDGGYERFLAHVGRRPTTDHSIDRIDPDGHYEPGNVRWAVKEVQANNKRNSVRVSAYGREMTMREASDFSGIGRTTLAHRLKLGMSPEEAMTAPIKTGPNAKA